MTGDDRLRSELEALEKSAPFQHVPSSISSPVGPRSRIGLIAATIVAAVAVTSLALGLGKSPEVGSQSSSLDPSGPSAVSPTPSIPVTVEPSPAASAGVTHVARRSMSFVLPPGWTYRLPDPILEWGPGSIVIYFSNQPMHDECIRSESASGTSATCGLPIDALAPDGVFIGWSTVGYYWSASPPPLPAGTPFELAGVDAVRDVVDPEDCDGLGATEAEVITLRRWSPSLDHLRICGRDVSDETRAQVEALLQSIAFDPAPDPTPIGTPFDDNPAEISGVLRGDPSLGALCTWLTDGNGDRWEIIWPEGYEDAFEGDEPVLRHHGEVVARGGDVITVTGATSTRYGTFCMVGIPYEANAVVAIRLGR